MRADRKCLLVLVTLLLAATGGIGQVIYETTTPYHHILVINRQDERVLQFDNAMQTRMSLRDPLKGHFDYTEYFHMPWLWNTNVRSVLMLGLGGGSAQRAWQHYYTNVMIETVELDPKVVTVAREFFGVNASPTHRIVVEDARLYLRRSAKKYDVIIMDAYTAGRYGSFIPYSLATREFFALAKDHLNENGVLAYNVIGTMQATRGQNILGALYQTMNVVFPRIHLFPAARSLNVVLMATRSSDPVALDQLNKRADALITQGKVTFPGFKQKLGAFRTGVPPAAEKAEILTDDFAPVDGMLSVEP